MVHRVDGLRVQWPFLPKYFLLNDGGKMRIPSLEMPILVPVLHACPLNYCYRIDRMYFWWCV